MPAEMRQVAFKAEDEDQHLVYGEVYAPDRPDAQHEFMRKEEIVKMAHRFMREQKGHMIDVQHNNKVVPDCYVVESFIAQKGDPIFIEGAWVVGVYVGDEELWQSIKKGDINGFSMEAMVSVHPQEVVLDIDPVIRGLTSKSEDHQHQFFVHYDEKGVLKGGTTDMVAGHVHQILHGTHTEITNGHSHRFSSVDKGVLIQENTSA